MTPQSRSVRPLEKVLLEPWQSAWRGAYGFAILPMVWRWRGIELSTLALLTHFAAALLALRIVPMLFRRLPLFSDALKAAWNDQRLLAKRYDSYQWAKLLWIGIGMDVFAAYAGHLMAREGLLASACVVAGALGTFLWRRARTADRTTASTGAATPPLDKDRRGLT